MLKFVCSIHLINKWERRKRIIKKKRNAVFAIDIVDIRARAIKLKSRKEIKKKKKGEKEEENNTIKRIDFELPTI